MFNDDESFTFKKMHELSPVDGFVEVGESMAEMIKYVANEPSVGLFYIQQHTQNAIPNLVNLKNKVADKSREMALHTEDSEDFISMVRSMREYGHPIADEMIKDIETSLSLMSEKQPKRGLVNNPSSVFKMGRSNSWGSFAWGRSPPSSPLQGSEKSVGYLSNVMKSAKERASSLSWSQMAPRDLKPAKGEGMPVDVSHQEPTSLAAASSSEQEAELDELPLSSKLVDEQEELQMDKSTSGDELLSLADNYSEFKADREVKLELWLAETGKYDSQD